MAGKIGEQKADNQEEWKLYYEKSVGQPPHFTLFKAIELLSSSDTKFAIDLGCGAGRASLALLEKGWRVLAIDKDKLPFDYFIHKLENTPARAHIEPLIAKFEELDLTLWPMADLINASYSLPFCTSEHFPDLWIKIEAHLKAGGVFAGQFFGYKHSWRFTKKGVTFHTEKKLMKLLKNFSLVYFEEEYKDSVDVKGDSVQWHVFHVVAQKIST